VTKRNNKNSSAVMISSMTQILMMTMKNGLKKGGGHTSQKTILPLNRNRNLCHIVMQYWTVQPV
jgi:hypothetical protein